ERVGVGRVAAGLDALLDRDVGQPDRDLDRLRNTRTAIVGDGAGCYEGARRAVGDGRIEDGRELPVPETPEHVGYKPVAVSRSGREGHAEWNGARRRRGRDAQGRGQIWLLSRARAVVA